MGITCADCKIEKSLELFEKCKKRLNGRGSYCKECKAKQQRDYRQKHLEKLRAKELEYRKIHKERITKNARKWVNDNPAYRKVVSLRSNLRLKYGLTLEQYEQLVREQNGVCKICEGLNLNGERLHVDHDHMSGKVRGLLCGNCNRGIGHLKNSVELCYKAADYLEGVPSLVRS